ncbi:MAG: hypothetical protein GY941_05990 [Planctomycetes bacterium]|nr:hypothetical protein [Planctomycetota bacterium]
MIRYKVIRRKNVHSLLVVMACIIGCGSMNINESQSRDVDIEVTSLKQSDGDGTDVRLDGEKEGSWDKTNSEEADRKESYLNEVGTEDVVSKESNHMTTGTDESELNEHNSFELRSESDVSREYFESKSDKYDETGIASFISDEYDGAMTASGYRYDRNGMTAAHPSLPFDTKIVVTNLRNKRSVELVVIDRFDPSNERILNVSHRAAVELDLMESGVVNVGIRIASDPEPGYK